MATAERIPEDDLARVRSFCEGLTPDHVRDQLRYEADVRGMSVTLVECRPHWRDPDAEWTRMKIAQLRYDRSVRTWTLHWADRNARWHRYWDLDPSEDVGDLLGEIDDDPTGIFLG